MPKKTASFFDACGLTTKMIVQIAYETGFCRRASGKIVVADLLKYFCEESVKGTVTHNDLAAKIHTATGVFASRQAYWRRINDVTCVNFFKAILTAIMFSKFDPHELDQLKKIGRFKRILIQDSTIIQLPKRLFDIFSGVKNAQSTTCHARIQGVYDILSGRFVKFAIDPYFKNDLSVAADIQVESGDLLLRDRGYFVPKIMGDHKKIGVDTISRYKHYTLLFDPLTNKSINLLELLKLHGSVDRRVLVGEKQKIPLRLLAVPVNEETANLRRMKAKKESKGHAPSWELLQLMSWTIFLVTIEDPAITIRHILILYGLRWRIENIFKTWKSNFSFSKIHNVSEKQLQVLLRARLIMILLFYHNAFMPLRCEVLRKYQQELSLMKFMRFVTRNLGLLQKLLVSRCWNETLLNAITRYCAYEKRKRQNFMTIFNNISMDLLEALP